MLINLFNFFRKKLTIKYTEKLKSNILKILFEHYLANGVNSKMDINSLECHKEIIKYFSFDNTLLKIALKELVNENKIIINTSSNIPSYSLTTDLFNQMNNNKHPVTAWLCNHIFDILNFILGLTGTITGILSLYLTNKK